jgi:hypothetical protein
MSQTVVDIDEQEFKKYLHTHETYLKQVRELEGRMDSLAPFELAKLEFLYTKLERAAWHIAGWYKKKAKYYEGMAEIEQGQEYKRLREDEKKTAADAQYYSRIPKGERLQEAGGYEGDFVTWKGIANTYERAANAIKDMIKAIESEGGK